MVRPVVTRATRQSDPTAVPWLPETRCAQDAVAPRSPGGELPSSGGAPPRLSPPTVQSALAISASIREAPVAASLVRGTWPASAFRNSIRAMSPTTITARDRRCEALAMVAFTATHPRGCRLAAMLGKTEGFQRGDAVAGGVCDVAGRTADGCMGAGCAAGAPLASPASRMITLPGSSGRYNGPVWPQPGSASASDAISSPPETTGLRDARSTCGSRASVTRLLMVRTGRTRCNKERVSTAQTGSVRTSRSASQPRNTR